MPRSLLSAALVLLLAACGADPAAEQAPSPEAALAQSADPLCLYLPPANQLLNPSFQDVGPIGSPTTVTTSAGGGAGYSAANNWTLFTNTPGTINTNLLPSTRAGDTSNMIHVVTNGAGNGLVQVFGTYGSGPTKTIARAWVYVLSGKVGIGTGNGGAAGYDAFSTTTGQWQQISASNGSIPANEFFIYASSAGGAEFFVDYASVTIAPNLLQNPTFATTGPAGSYTYVNTYPYPGTAGYSAAASWTLFTNTPGIISSQLVPSTLAGGVQMINVMAFGTGNGLVQLFKASNPCDLDGPDHVQAGAWVYLTRGTVCIGTGNGGSTGYDACTSVLNSWQWLQANNGVSPANEFIVYAASPSGANFNVGFARVNEIP